ncbi:GNAT family N-acetyltransferase [Saccharomonospora viridis]|jgi:RimJ/RimL family protein N-acetyltransferase|uniref:Acetyltransferase, ribosomal protein N-acetylase n=2 Tax=Saccharomonospora viridis TaxID=1852 RepID=C7MWS5_SACVD|nr:GNAT family N-acetyltransferase [Saccharomonospora viridis]ACU97179.1 acetyltransferase, ribosomal protein N-acetylase [Saccharomonospora viridis DSM 43017]KHF43439.1 GNAT family acetyltransferase [Saccharomonospora viridis]SFO79109.1 Protein N-acetyltransferase, RimJ/RimL family [Saccharomonospora viridis]
MERVLVTERMTLRRFTSADAEDLVALHGDADVMRFVDTGRPVPADVVRHETLPRLLAEYDRLDGLGVFAAQHNDHGAFLGWFEFRPPRADALDDVELGYRLHRRYWGQGLATEGAKALIEWGFTERGVRRVFATAMTVNHASRRVLEKVGLRYVRTFFEDWPDPIDGTEHGDMEYALTRTEWVAA